MKYILKNCLNLYFYANKIYKHIYVEICKHENIIINYIQIFQLF